MATGKFVAYYRVSTQKQGAAGLGVAAQRTAVKQFLDGGRWSLVREYVEVESGKVNTRPQLAKALHMAKVTGARLVIAKLDRLSRNAAFLLTLRDSGTKFVAADMPEADELTVGILAVVAEAERRAISTRTKAALAEAKRRGTKLGNPHGAAAIRHLGNARAVRANVARAGAFAADVAPILAEHAGDSLKATADALNHQGIRTPRGTGRWTPMTVSRLRRRIAEDGC